MKTNVSESMGEDTLATTSVGEQHENIPPAYFVTNGTCSEHAGPVSAIKIEQGTTQTIMGAKKNRRWTMPDEICGAVTVAILGIGLMGSIFIVIFV